MGLGAMLAWVALCAAHPPIAFVPASPQLAAPAEEYRRIWEADGEQIVAVMEEVAGVPYPDSAIEVIVSEGKPMTSYDGRTIRLRGRYSAAYKKATLVHEIGHRLAFTLRRPPELDDHKLLYLFLYDVWTDLYGQAFADRMVSIERQIGPAYAAAWDFVLAMSRGERQAMLRTLRS
ncbi:MAG: hypothetical protein ACXW2T_01405 [Allosphingosinicella sp.]